MHHTYSAPNGHNDEVDSIEFLGIREIDSLTNDQLSTLNSVIDDAFVTMGTKDIGCMNMIEHVMHTDSPLIKTSYYPLSPVMQKVVNSELDTMLKIGIVKPPTPPWSSSIVMAQKKYRWQFCVNYKKLISVSIPNAYHISYVSSILDKLRDERYLITLDIKSA